MDDIDYSKITVYDHALERFKMRFWMMYAHVRPPATGEFVTQANMQLINKGDEYAKKLLLDIFAKAEVIPIHAMSYRDRARYIRHMESDNQPAAAKFQVTPFDFVVSKGPDGSLIIRTVEIFGRYKHLNKC